MSAFTTAELAALIERRRTDLARMTLDEITAVVADMGGTHADAVKVFDAVTAHIAPYLTAA